MRLVAFALTALLAGPALAEDAEWWKPRTDLQADPAPKPPVVVQHHTTIVQHTIIKKVVVVKKRKPHCFLVFCR